jgi:hypothetical protein
VSAIFTRRFGRTVLGALALPAALCVAAGAGPAPDKDRHGRDRWGSHDRDRQGRDRHDRGGLNIGVVLGSWPRREVIVRHPPVVISRPAVRCYEDVVPCQLGFAAYQSGNTIILVATGANRGSGFTTCLTDVDACTGVPVVTMRNTPTCEVDPHCATTTPFTLTASIRSHCVQCVKVTLAGQTYDVPVVEARPLS